MWDVSIVEVRPTATTSREFTASWVILSGPGEPHRFSLSRTSHIFVIDEDENIVNNRENSISIQYISGSCLIYNHNTFRKTKRIHHFAIVYSLETTGQTPNTQRNDRSKPIKSHEIKNEMERTEKEKEREIERTEERERSKTGNE